jgi:hypothetical protein
VVTEADGLGGEVVVWSVVERRVSDGVLEELERRVLDVVELEDRDSERVGEVETVCRFVEGGLTIIEVGLGT